MYSRRLRWRPAEARRYCSTGWDIAVEGLYLLSLVGVAFLLFSTIVKEEKDSENEQESAEDTSYDRPDGWTALVGACNSCA
jgi:hypothetical protein